MLSQYKFKILYTLGKENGRADALSQRHDLAGRGPHHVDVTADELTSTLA